MKMSLSDEGMARFEDALLRLSTEVYSDALKTALDAAAATAVPALKAAADRFHGGGSGRMRDSITAGTPTVTLDGGTLTISLKGQKARKWRYYDQGAELNYGSGRRTATGWFDKGQDEVRDAVEGALCSALEAFITGTLDNQT